MKMVVERRRDECARVHNVVICQRSTTSGNGKWARTIQDDLSGVLALVSFWCRGSAIAGIGAGTGASIVARVSMKGRGRDGVSDEEGVTESRGGGDSIAFVCLLVFAPLPLDKSNSATGGVAVTRIGAQADVAQLLEMSMMEAGWTTTHGSQICFQAL